MVEKTNSFFSLFQSIAERGLSHQEQRPGDYFNEEGLLICGTCGEPRQKYLEIRDSDELVPAHTKRLLITAQCRCDREKEEKKRKEKQAEKDLALVHRLKCASLMDERFEDSIFEQFQISKHNGRNLKLCKRYAERFDLMIEKNQGLLFWGNVGTGKSYAAACIANYLLSHKVPVVMTSFVKILEAIQNNKDRESDLISRLNRTRLVIFDDLGAERGTDYALEKVYNIIDERYRKKLPMILTTNLTLDEMKEKTDIRYSRIYDRIFECCYPLQFTGPSWRKREASKRFDEIERLLAEGDGNEG